MPHPLNQTTFQHAYTHLFSYLCLVPSRQDLEVRLQGTSLNGLLVEVVVRLLPKQDVVLESCILYPGLLWDICNTTLQWEKWTMSENCKIKNRKNNKQHNTIVQKHNTTQQKHNTTQQKYNTTETQYNTAETQYNTTETQYNTAETQNSTTETQNQEKQLKHKDNKTKRHQQHISPSW